MLVVSDSSPFIGLVKIGHVDLLPKLYGTIVIPPEVAQELSEPKRPAEVQAFMASPPAWLIIQSPKIVENIPELDVGERAAISLARELNADRLLIDENAGREAAIARNIKTLRTTAVLLDAANLGIIPDLNAAYDALEKTNFRVKRSVLDQLLKAHEHFKAAERERSRDDDFEHDR